MNPSELDSKLTCGSGKDDIIEKPSLAEVNLKGNSLKSNFKLGKFVGSKLNNCAKNQSLSKEIIDNNEVIKISPPTVTTTKIRKSKPSASNAKLGRHYRRKKKQMQSKNPKSNTCIMDDKNSDENVFCVISEVMGNANAVFENSVDTCETLDNLPFISEETNDITKIKGWRKKNQQEKPTSDFNKLPEEVKTVETPKCKESKNLESIFVSDSLDNFLKNEAKLNVNYEIPHLAAESSIKLTSDIVASKPNFSHETPQCIDTKYSKSLPTTNKNDAFNNTEKIKKDLKKIIIKKIEMSKVWKSRNSRKKTFKTITNKTVTKIPEVKTKELEVYLEQKPYTMNEELLKNLNLESKLVGLTVYLGNGQPLHPVVQAHLKKLRNSNIEIDNNWANFASSAVKGEKQRLTKMILPVYICGKADQAEKVNFGTQTNNEPILFQENLNEQTLTVTPMVKLKNCTDILEKLKFPHMNIWCIEHNCYNCKPCEHDKKQNHFELKKIRKFVDLKKDRKSSEQIPSCLNKEQGNVLMNKIREIKCGVKPKNVEDLKKYQSKGIELIKLNFVKESFLSGDVNIWHMKPNEEGSGSRALLTFSKTLPFPNAINLKSEDLPLCNLPQILTKFLIKDKLFSANEYALLFFNGNVWEIQAFLNVDKNVVNSNNIEADINHIFTSSSVPELAGLHSISYKRLKMKYCKWCVVDLCQDFEKIAIWSKSVTTVFRLKKLRNFVKLRYGYIRIKRTLKQRLLGIYNMRNLLPFILIGPFRDFEKVRIMALNNGKQIPLEYFCDTKPKLNRLKYYINSLIAEYQHSYLKVNVLWLYDRIFLDKTFFLEALYEYNYSNMKYNSNIEHNYCLRSLPTSPMTKTTHIRLESSSGKKQSEIPNTKVYIYFEIFDLGYVEGELRADNSVVIEHPLDNKSKIQSVEVGQEFIEAIRKKIQFIPNDIKVGWSITKHKEKVKDREPFDKYYLTGGHFLCKKGIFYLLTLTDSKIEELELKEEQIFNALSERNVFAEIKHLKKLSKIIGGKDGPDMTAMEVVEKAIIEIQFLKKDSDEIAKEIDELMEERLDKAFTFLKNLNDVKVSEHTKMQIVSHMYHVFDLETNKASYEHFCKWVKQYTFGREFLRSLQEKKPEDKNLRNGDSKCSTGLKRNHSALKI